MSGAGKRQRLTLRIAAIPMGLLAVSCLYPIFFAVNNALKTRHDYMVSSVSFFASPLGEVDTNVGRWPCEPGGMREGVWANSRSGPSYIHCPNAQ